MCVSRLYECLDSRYDSASFLALFDFPFFFISPCRLDKHSSSLHFIYKNEGLRGKSIENTNQ